MVKRFVHAFADFVSRFAAKLLPDRIPVTFVGAGSVADLAGSIRQQGVTKVLVVTDSVLTELGIVSRVTAALSEAGVDAVVYDGVRPDPTFAQVKVGHAHYAAAGCQGVLALGGGSPIDAAKVIAAMATNGGNIDKLEGKLRVRRAPAPLFAIPTTAGTGSEVTVAAVISDTDTHLKKFFLDPKLLPTMTALDPTLMVGIPAPITAATGMDALTHAVESYLAKTATPQTQSYATISVRLVFEHLLNAFRNGADLEARQGMALASYYGGLAFTRTSVGYVHAIAHNLGAYYGTPHGLANALALPHVLDFSEQAAQRQLAELGDVIDVPGDTDAAKARGFIEAVRSLAASLEIPTTLEALRADDVPALADLAMAEAFLDYPVPRYMSKRDCEGVITKLLPTA